MKSEHWSEDARNRTTNTYWRWSTRLSSLSDWLKKLHNSQSDFYFFLKHPLSLGMVSHNHQSLLRCPGGGGRNHDNERRDGMKSDFFVFHFFLTLFSLLVIWKSVLLLRRQFWNVAKDVKDNRPWNDTNPRISRVTTGRRGNKPNDSELSSTVKVFDKPGFIVAFN